MLSVAIITCNEEGNIERTLRSVMPIADEVVIVDSGSTDLTLEIARHFGPKVKIFHEPWKGFVAQKNESIAKATGNWVLSLDADEEVTPELAAEIRGAMEMNGQRSGSKDGQPRKDFLAFSVPRTNMFLGRWIKHGGAYPDRKIRLVQRGTLWFTERRVHEQITVSREALAAGARLIEFKSAVIHHAYPTLSLYIEHMNRYSSLGAEIVLEKGSGRFSIVNIILRPLTPFIQNYIFRRGFLDGREGLLFHLYHSVYVSWKYAKAWELSRRAKQSPALRPGSVD